MKIITCFKCNGSKVNKSKKPCKKCNGTGIIDNKFMDDIYKICKEEMQGYMP